MIAYRLTVNRAPVIVTLDSDSPNRTASLRYQGKAEAIAIVKRFLEWEYGVFGHFVGSDRATPIDLECALNSARGRRFAPYRFSGGELVQDYNPAIPDDSIT